MREPSTTCGTCPTMIDCDDTNPDVNPAEAEDGFDVNDNDCDGSQLVRRDYVSGLVSATLSSLATSHASWTGDVVRMQPVSGAAATLTTTAAATWSRGAMYAAIHLNTNGAAPCTLDYRLNGASTWSTAATLALGDNAALIPISPGGTLSGMRARCTGTGGVTDLDWLTLCNSPTVWPPLTDVQMTFTDMHTPDYGSAPASVRVSEDGQYLYVTTDAGGFAWSDDASTWHMANGTGLDFA